MKNKIDLINEQDVIDIKLQVYQNYIDNLQDKETFVNSLPYADDQPRHGLFKLTSCDQVSSRMFKYGVIVGIVINYLYVFKTHQGSTTPLRWWKNVVPFSIGHGIFFYSLSFFYPTCQVTNRDDMGPQIAEEIILRTLIEKCDMYDYIDSILDLKYKYSDFEIYQLSKELKNMRMDNSLDNFKYFREVSNKKV